jgi:NTE family protein
VEMGRVGLVLGAGGTVGHAYHAGVLAALEEATSWRPDSAEVIVGTSAGSLVAALIRAGFSGSDLAGASLGKPVSAAGQALFSRLGRRTPLPAPGMTPASLLRGPAAARLLLRPRGVRLTTLAAALLPAGSLSTEAVAAGVRNLYGSAWPEKPTWICAVRLDDGRLVVFGRPGSPPASMAEAVAASCAIPAYFEPVLMGGVRHVDGGVHSVTNADQLAGLDLDLVLVSCPMGSARALMSLDLPVRTAVRIRLAQEVASLRRAGVAVVAFLPTAADRLAMGPNPMAAGRREAVTRQAYESTLARLEEPELRGRLAALG